MRPSCSSAVASTSPHYFVAAVVAPSIGPLAQSSAAAVGLEVGPAGPAEEEAVTAVVAGFVAAGPAVEIAEALVGVGSASVVAGRRAVAVAAVEVETKVVVVGSVAASHCPGAVVVPAEVGV